MMRFYIRFDGDKPVEFVQYSYECRTMTEVSEETFVTEYKKHTGNTFPPEQLPQPTEMELAQQEITDLQLDNIAQGQQMTDLELMILWGVTNV